MEGEMKPTHPIPSQAQLLLHNLPLKAPVQNHLQHKNANPVPSLELEKGKEGKVRPHLVLCCYQWCETCAPCAVGRKWCGITPPPPLMVGWLHG